MKLQLALDDISLKDALDLGEKVKNYIDIFEMGSPFIIENGSLAIKEFKRRFPEKKILADTKIVDAGSYEAGLAFKAGADYCTVIGLTDILTIKECLKAARKYNKSIFVDTINIENLNKRIPELEAAGVDHISVHVGVDEQAVGKTPIDALRQVKSLNNNSILSVAGGIKADTVDLYKKSGADIVIVGGGINHAKNSVLAAKKLAEKIND